MKLTIKEYVFLPYYCSNINIKHKHKHQKEENYFVLECSVVLFLWNSVYMNDSQQSTEQSYSVNIKLVCCLLNEKVRSLL